MRKKVFLAAAVVTIVGLIALVVAVTTTGREQQPQPQISEQDFSMGTVPLGQIGYYKPLVGR